ncbi:MAG: GatB/YqeY domain-containing protein, partial [Propionibacteriaceae bacterium]|nr:GatB/YqeY domain-containing protein [Propionibacteriaceae bacterium]
PAGLTEAELDAIVAEEVAAAAAGLGAAPTMKQMGLVIKAVNTRAAGRAEGAKVAAKVKAALS